MSSIRIASGIWKRSVIRVADFPDLRPTLMRIRVTLGDWMRPLQPLTVIDLFAGTGAVGFELASQGAQRVLLIERHPEIASNLQANVERIKGASQRIEVVNGDAISYLNQAEEQFDLIIVDPPFRANFREIMEKVLSSKICGKNTKIYSEQPVKSAMAVPQNWGVEHSTTSGEVVAQVWSRGFSYTKSALHKEF